MSIRQNFPTVSPTLTLDFINSSQLDPRITFIRTGSRTRMNENGLVESVGADIPRFEHRYEDGVVKPQGLLLEEAKAQLVRNSNDFTLWTKQTNGSGVVGVAVTDATTSPDGTNNSSKFYVDTAGGSFYSINRSIGINSNTDYTYSVFAKQAESSEIDLTIFTGSNGGNQNVNYNLSNGTVTDITTSGTNTGIDTAGIIPYPNDWYRCHMTFNVNESISIQYKLGNGTTTLNQGIYIYGAQLESRHMTSYIPNSTSSTLSTSVDRCYIDNLDTQGLINQSEFTIHIEGKYNPTVKQVSTAYLRMMETRTGLGTQRTSGLWLDPTTQTDIIRYRADDDNENNKFLQTYNTTDTNAVDTGKDGLIRVAFGLKSGDFDISVNGGSLESSSNTGFAQDTGQLIIGGSDTSGNNIMNGTLRKLSIYPNKLTDTQLINLSKVSI